MSINASSLTQKDKLPKISPIERGFRHSSAENNFVAWIQKRYPKIEVTKKGLPDFMLIKDGEVVGFVEVKRDWYDNLRPTQKLFAKFCRKLNIPYQTWKPTLFRKRSLALKRIDKKYPLVVKSRKPFHNRYIFFETEGGMINWNKL